MNEYTTLLIEWCNRLLDLQIIHAKEPTMHGAVFCPACARVHGRFPDSVYPLVLLYDKLGEQKYLDSAKLMIDWAEYNLTYDGGYHNDKDAHWPATSVFFGIAFGKTLLHHGACLDKETYEKWYAIFERVCDFVYRYFDSDGFHPVINYPVGESCLMALAYKLLRIEKYREKALEKVAFIKEHFNGDGLLMGEGHPYKLHTSKGCNLIDIGYNVEESLPALIECAVFLEDDALLAFFADSFKSHIEFMLPDGAWDNSIGSRAYKWTYWGSRTSDGCQIGLAYLADKDPVFAEAAQRSFALYRSLTHDGLLYGGKMFVEANEEPCVHHTFCHAKALATMIDLGFSHDKHVRLPREISYGVKHIRSTGARLISTGGWCATVGDSDAFHHRGADVSGGTVSMLWHEKTGPILSGAMDLYHCSMEHSNMQNTRNRMCSLGNSVKITNGSFSSLNEIHAECTHSAADGKAEVTAKGVLRDADYNGHKPYYYAYVFTKDKMELIVCSHEENTFFFPVITPKNSFREINSTHFTVTHPHATVHICTDRPMEVSEERFCTIGGFLFRSLSCGGNAKVTVLIE